CVQLGPLDEAKNGALGVHFHQDSAAPIENLEAVTLPSRGEDGVQRGHRAVGSESAKTVDNVHPGTGDGRDVQSFPGIPVVVVQVYPCGEREEFECLSVLSELGCQDRMD